ncbi:hypothetical protein Glove_151g166 [Diversispora epigaea]|uniref:Uncharacterized protein n=1 Tax=Diversispora epigaea TaxID=1348612 RepID=A0A397IVX0_9GLOM|nr:hypothetical protein Glove_151g166 [Diversispora epigaea]
MAVVKANEILLPLFNSRKNNVTFEIPPSISEVLIKKREGGKGKDVEGGEKTKGRRKRSWKKWMKFFDL